MHSAVLRKQSRCTFALAGVSPFAIEGAALSTSTIPWGSIPATASEPVRKVHARPPNICERLMPILAGALVGDVQSVQASHQSQQR